MPQTDDQSAVDCSTASQDIAQLQHEKKSTDERKVKRVFGIMPIGIVVDAAAGGHEKAGPDKEMQIAEHSARMDSRIAEMDKELQGR